MKQKNIFITIVLTLVIGTLFFIVELTKTSYSTPNTVYQVYLDGKELGIIGNEEELYQLINEEQSEIIEKYGRYGVDYVYPPNNFEIVKRITYANNITQAKTIYNNIKEETEFTIKGYIVSFKSPDEETENIEVYIIDTEILRGAIVELISSFVDSNQFEAYINDNQIEIVETGERIESMDFEENITIKETYIGVNQKIYTDSSELARYLLFGDTEVKKTYVVKQGDTVESIAYNNELNEQEFLIANSQIPTITTPLAIGEVVAIDLINPQLTLKYTMLIVEDVEVAFESDIVYDNTKPSSYKETTQKGVKGINRATKKVQVVNGEESQGVEEIDYKSIKEPIKEIITRGRQYFGGYTPGTHVDTGQTWAWPTNSPYIISSEYKWRWGTFHDGIDITGTGYGSYIYAVDAGKIISAGWGGIAGNNAGYNVIIDHLNGYYTLYAHLAPNSITVRVGDMVSRKQVIGGMGASGFVTGTHLHFSVAIGGIPYNGGSFINPMNLWQ